MLIDTYRCCFLIIIKAMLMQRFPVWGIGNKLAGKNIIGSSIKFIEIIIQNHSSITNFNSDIFEPMHARIYWDRIDKLGNIFPNEKRQFVVTEITHKNDRSEPTTQKKMVRARLHT